MHNTSKLLLNPRGLLDFGANDPQAMAAELIPNTAFASLDTPTTASRLLALVGGPTPGGPRRERFAPASGARPAVLPGFPSIPGTQSVIPLGGGTPSAVPSIGPVPPTGGGNGTTNGSTPPGTGGLPGGGGGGGGSFTPPPTTTTPPQPPVIGAPVPEPGVWAMMILGVALIGAALRRRGGMAVSRRVKAGSILPR